MSGAMVQGFADPPLDAQSVFRILLDAMAHPGRIRSVATDKADVAMPRAPGELDQAAFVLALTLIDFETPVSLDAKLAADQPVVDALRFHCGCPIIDDPARADFALIGDALEAPGLSAFHQGTPEYPDRATTVVMQVQSLDDTSGVRLTGPGIQTEARLAITGGPPKFWPQWSANHQQFPLGVDLLVTAGDRIAALPRSIQVEV